MTVLCFQQVAGFVLKFATRRAPSPVRSLSRRARPGNLDALVWFIRFSVGNAAWIGSQFKWEPVEITVENGNWEPLLHSRDWPKMLGDGGLFVAERDGWIHAHSAPGRHQGGDHRDPEQSGRDADEGQRICRSDAVELVGDEARQCK